MSCIKINLAIAKMKISLIINKTRPRIRTFARFNIEITVILAVNVRVKTLV